jgi:hypothetical protein
MTSPLYGAFLKIYGTKVFLLTKIKPEYSDILYNPTQFRGLLVCGIRQVPQYYYLHHEADIIPMTIHTFIKWLECFTYVLRH